MLLRPLLRVIRRRQLFVAAATTTSPAPTAGTAAAAAAGGGLHPRLTTGAINTPVIEQLSAPFYRNSLFHSQNCIRRDVRSVDTSYNSSRRRGMSLSSSSVSVSAASTAAAAAARAPGRVSAQPPISLQDFSRMEAAFKEHIGSNALDELCSNIDNEALVIALGGDQLTGKSTLSKRLAKYLGGSYKAAGSVFRQIASEKGMTVGELSKHAAETPAIDVHIDYRLCELTAMGTDAAAAAAAASSSSANASRKPVLILEGRQPAVMAEYVQLAFGKANVVSIYLSCSYREQALRLIGREVGDEAFNVASEQLPLAPAGVSPEQGFPSLHALQPELEKLDIPDRDVQKVIELFLINENRDADDRRRYEELYGFHPERMGYRQPYFYDLRIDTTPNQPEDTFVEAVEGLERLGVVSSQSTASSL